MTKPTPQPYVPLLGPTLDLTLTDKELVDAYEELNAHPVNLHRTTIERVTVSGTAEEVAAVVARFTAQRYRVVSSTPSTTVLERESVAP